VAVADSNPELELDDVRLITPELEPICDRELIAELETV